MVFSSQIFLFFFFPIVVMGYFLFYKHLYLKNIWLMLTSVFFYAYGERRFVFILLVMTFLNWIMSWLICKYETYRKIFLALAVAGNVLLIVIFKYSGFIVNNLNLGFKLNLPEPNIALPIGISFFTFQAISYIIDVYRRDVEVSKTPLETGLYLMFFPQLIAGPIIRYKSIAKEISCREESISDISEGIERFIIGLGKKVLLSNTLGETADMIFGGTLESSVLLSWIGAVAYMFQIYYDFSGYSDMAIGLGRIFGFHFMENFNYPYISKSITEFWHRWHISLSSWFRDYVYIPLGGNRVSRRRLLFNLFVVWTLTGIWHGANWTFIIWGLYNLTFLILEKFTRVGQIQITPCLRNIGTLLIVLIGWVLFRSDSLSDAIIYLRSMFGGMGVMLWNDTSILYLQENIILIMLAAIFGYPITNYMKQLRIPKQILGIGKLTGLAVIFIFSLSFIIKGAYNPFIYFNF